MPWSELSAELAQRKDQFQFRSRQTWDQFDGVRLSAGSKTLMVFCSNDYLGLAAHRDLKAASINAINQWGTGSTASHLVCGHSREHELLEQELADFTGRDRAVVFSTGYMANLGAVSALLGKRDALFHDRLNHASLLDAGQLSGALCRRFQHTDVEHLRSLLQRSTKNNAIRRRLIASDGVFSMDGDVAPLAELAQLAEEFNTRLMIDDAHGLGVLGPNGSGSAMAAELSQHDVPILVGTLGKSFGSFGAFVAGSEELTDTIIQYARSYIYTTAMPPGVAAASRAALKIIRENPERRAHLHQLIAHFRSLCQSNGITLLESYTAIQALVVGKSEAAVKLSDYLFENGFLVKAIRPPTVPKGSARLRITLSAAHTNDDVRSLVDALNEGLLQLGISSNE